MDSHYFGTYRRAQRPLRSAAWRSRPRSGLPSLTQRFLDTSLNVKTVSPFLMPQAVTGNNGQLVPIYPADEISVDHSHQGMVNSEHGDGSDRRNDRFAMDQPNDSHRRILQYRKGRYGRIAITFAQAPKVEADLCHIDCGGPFMWRWAKNFVLFGSIEAR